MVVELHVVVILEAERRKVCVISPQARRWSFPSHRVGRSALFGTVISNLKNKKLVPILLCLAVVDADAEESVLCVAAGS